MTRRRSSHRFLRLGALLALAAVGCSKRTPPPVARVPVAVARAERRAVPYAVSATGTVEPMATVAVTSQVGGVLVAVHFREGEEVRQGQILFEIDPRPYQAALEQALANLSRDLVQHENAAREAGRARTLAQSGLGTAEDAQAKQAAEDALAATVRADSAAITAARLNLDYATVRAPISGRTGSLLVREGNLVRSGSPQTLVTINQIHPILVRFAVPASRLPDLQRRGGQPLGVTVRQGGRDDARPIEGVLSFMDNHVDSATGTVMLKARFANADGALWPGEFVDVTLVLGVETGATVVPAQAVVNSQLGPYVFTVGSDLTVRSQPVSVARTADSLAVIASGIEPGAVVVTDGQLRLTSGARVEIRGGAAEGSGTGSLGAGAGGPAPAPPASSRGNAGAGSRGGAAGRRSVP